MPTKEPKSVVNYTDAGTRPRDSGRGGNGAVGWLVSVGVLCQFVVDRAAHAQRGVPAFPVVFDISEPQWTDE